MNEEIEKNTTKTSFGTKLKNAISIVMAILFIILGFSTINQTLIGSILLIIAGIILIPEINNNIKKLLKLEESNKTYTWIKFIFILCAFMYCVNSMPQETIDNTKLKEEIESLNGQVQNITQEKNSLLEKYNNSENKIKELSKQIKNTVDTGTLENTIIEKDTKIKELENTVSTNLNKIKELENTISSKDSKIKELEEDVEKLEKENDTLEDKVTGLSSTKTTSSSSTITKTTTKSNSTSSTTNSYTVYITKTGGKYHRDGCSYLKSKIAIDKSSAISQGYGACSRCNP